MGAARLPAEADRGSTGRPWTGLSATALPFLVVLLPTFQKGDLAKQQPVYQGRVGEGGQGDGAEPGAKEGLGLRVGRGLAIDCDGQGCEDEERDLGRHCVSFRESATWPVATASSITNTLCSRIEGEGQRASWWPKTLTNSHFWCFFGLSASDHHCLHKLHCALSPEALQMALVVDAEAHRSHFLKLKPPH